MAWPNDRLTTYAPDSEVESADLNALQDAIIDGQHGEETVVVPPSAAQTSDIAEFSAVAWSSRDSAVATVVYGLPLAVGDRVTAVNLWILEPNLAGEELTAGIYRTTKLDLSDEEAVVSLKESGISGAQATLAWTGSDGVPFTVAAGWTYYMRVVLAQTSANLEAKTGTLFLTVDHP